MKAAVWTGSCVDVPDRQGDPGTSQFYVSLEDDLMRMFGSERIAGLMDRFGYKEGEVIQHGMISKSIERAQRKVEENNFGIRKRLLEYDDVMNKEHLREMDDLKQSVQNAAYEQKDPLLIYKSEAFKLFEQTLARINKELVQFLMNASLPTGEQNVQQAHTPRRTDTTQLKTSRQEGGGPKKEERQAQPIRVEDKIGRNDPCPCGSGKKYKQCHGA
jgi:preprotein translocase subunit SecA